MQDREILNKKKISAHSLQSGKKHKFWLNAKKIKIIFYAYHK